MANRIKHKLAYRISKELNIPCASSCFKIMPTEDQDLLNLCWSVEDKDVSDKLVGMSEVLREKNGISSVKVAATRKYQNVNFFVDSHYLLKTVIKECLNPYKAMDLTSKKVLVEFSSPNMAKPFHVGHFRSTIIGNFLANVNKYADNEVTKVNYLGDWGTQCGMLKVGVDLCHINEEKLRNNPIEILYDAYVRANKLAGLNNDINIEAKRKFNDLENGDPEMLKEWNMFKTHTLKELSTTYNRLGIDFDVYDSESMYNSKVLNYIMNDLEKKKIINTDTSGQKVIYLNDEKVPLIKSDGSSLYLARDIAAAHDRYTRFNFDEMLYVVDNSQAKHFNHLFNILQKMDSPLIGKCKHVRFGRINGMSTRKGKVIFLKDVLDEARDRMQTVRLNTKTTRGSILDTDIAESLAVSGLIIHDLRHKRERDYTFNWENALQFNGDTGVKLQYTHCRLLSIERNCDVEIPTECVPKHIQEPECVFLIHQLSQFQDVLQESTDLMEPSHLVKYLFILSSLANKAIGEMRVKNKPEEIAQQRLLLLHSTRLVIKRGMEILGLKVLNEM